MNILGCYIIDIRVILLCNMTFIGSWVLTKSSMFDTFLVHVRRFELKTLYIGTLRVKTPYFGMPRGAKMSLALNEPK